MNRSHETLVESQFGSRAGAYLTSEVHAHGADLEALTELARRRPGARILDLGCGGGHVSFGAAPHAGEVVAYDLSTDMLAVVEATAKERGLRNVNTRQGTAEDLPFEDASFDVVLSRYSAHHWRDFAGGLREAARVLKPGGVAGFVDAVAPGTALRDTFFQTIEMLRDPSHVRDYARAEWEACLAAAGLVCETTRRFRVRLDFTSWVGRMATPDAQVAAIRALQKAVSSDVTSYFETTPDGSFSIDVALFEAGKMPAG
ncbi:class I SAM-dependent methyltransferase [Bradyrhizobium sp.]|uniref:class I SAM-dependent methyltransferase n=1 Tax=Bradyrhizobium sp. TaxID=376 RepID=UPI003C426091